MELHASPLSLAARTVTLGTDSEATVISSFGGPVFSLTRWGAGFAVGRCYRGGRVPGKAGLALVGPEAANGVVLTPAGSSDCEFYEIIVVQNRLICATSSGVLLLGQEQAAAALAGSRSVHGTLVAVEGGSNTILAVGSDGAQILHGNNEGIGVVDVRGVDNRALETIPPVRDVMSMCQLPDGRVVIGCDADDEGRLWILPELPYAMRVIARAVTQISGVEVPAYVQQVWCDGKSLFIAGFHQSLVLPIGSQNPPLKLEHGAFRFTQIPLADATTLWLGTTGTGVSIIGMPSATGPRRMSIVDRMADPINRLLGDLSRESMWVTDFAVGNGTLWIASEGDQLVGISLHQLARLLHDEAQIPRPMDNLLRASSERAATAPSATGSVESSSDRAAETAHAQIECADAHIEADELDAATDALEKAGEVLGPRHERALDHDLLERFAATHDRLAARYRSLDRHPEATHHFQRSLQLRRDSVGEGRERFFDLHDLSVCLLDFGGYLRRTDRVSLAVQHYEEALSILRSLHVDSPEDLDIIKLLSSTHALLAMAFQTKTDRLRDAYHSYMEALSFFLKLHLAVPGDMQARSMFNDFLGTVLSFHEKMGIDLAFWVEDADLAAQLDRYLAGTLLPSSDSKIANLSMMQRLVASAEHLPIGGRGFLYQRFKLGAIVEQMCLAKTWDDTRALLEANPYVASVTGLRIIRVMAALPIDTAGDLRALEQVVSRVITSGAAYAFALVDLEGAEAGRFPPEVALARVHKDSEALRKALPEERASLWQRCLGLVPAIRNAKTRDVFDQYFRFALVTESLNRGRVDLAKRQIATFLKRGVEDATLKADLQQLAAEADARAPDPFAAPYFDERPGQALAYLLLEPAWRIGDIAVLRSIAQGASGEILLGRMVEDGVLTKNLMIMKRLLPDRKAKRASVSGFLSEGLKLLGIDHPLISYVITVGVDSDNVNWYGMPFAHGGSLADRLADGRPLSTIEATHHLLATTLALGSLHRGGVVHLDVKPENVLFFFEEVEGEGHWKVVLSDLGLAQRLEDLSALRGFRGTAAYAAPEQMAGRIAGTSADIYALGLIALDLFDGRRPRTLNVSAAPLFSDGVDLLDDAREDDLPSALASVPPWLRPLVQACLDPVPANRPDASAFLEHCAKHVAIAIRSDRKDCFVGATPEQAAVVFADQLLYRLLQAEPAWTREPPPGIHLGKVKFGLDGFRRAFMLAGLTDEPQTTPYVRPHAEQNREIVRHLEEGFGPLDEPGGPLLRYFASPSAVEVEGVGYRTLKGERRPVKIPTDILVQSLLLYLRTMAVIVEDTALDEDMAKLRGVVERCLRAQVLRSSEDERFSLAVAAVIVGFLDEAQELAAPLVPTTTDVIELTEGVPPCLAAPPFPVVKNLLQHGAATILEKVASAQGRFAEATKLALALHLYWYKHYRSYHQFAGVMIHLWYAHDWENLRVVVRVGSYQHIDIASYFLSLLHAEGGGTPAPVLAKKYEDVLEKTRNRICSVQKGHIVAAATMAGGEVERAKVLARAVIERRVVRLVINTHVLRGVQAILSSPD